MAGSGNTRDFCRLLCLQCQHQSLLRAQAGGLPAGLSSFRSWSSKVTRGPRECVGAGCLVFLPHNLSQNMELSGIWGAMGRKPLFCIVHMYPAAPFWEAVLVIAEGGSTMAPTLRNYILQRGERSSIVKSEVMAETCA